MADSSSIEWTDSTWNPVTGCTEVSPGCDHCYAKTFAERWRGTPGHYFERGFDVVLRPERLGQPLSWHRPRKIFVNSMSDLFHEQVPDDFIAHTFAIMAICPQHTFQLLTKRHGRMRSLLNSPRFQAEVHAIAEAIDLQHSFQWPIPNLWLGVSVEDQHWANIRIPALLHTPAAVRFLSMEPLLGPVTFRWAKWAPLIDASHLDSLRGIEWVIVGGESGHGARPMEAEWVRTIRDECLEAGVAFLFKQWGAHDELGIRMTKKASGRELDGRTWDQFPATEGE